MASQIRSIDFLPEVFRTKANEQLLSATLDQLIQEPKLAQTQGYIGRRVGPGVNPNDSYIPELTAPRNNYQLEPGVTFLKPNTPTADGALTYPGLVDRIGNEGGLTNRYDRLFNSEYYSWDPFVDFDKFINFSQYYWLPDGPDEVDVFATDIPLTQDFTVTRTAKTLTFSGEAGNLPTITIARQGNYTFAVNQPGNPFWIQTVPGADGTLSYNDRSSRDILGVTNNGDDQGTISFNVPTKSAQDFYVNLTSDGNVDLVSSLQLDDINGQRLSTFLATYKGIDGITDLRSRTVIFLAQPDGLEGGWTLDGSTEITDDSTKYAVWRINYSSDSDPILSLTVEREVNNLKKLLVNYGTVYGDYYMYKDANGYYAVVPLITANLDTLYYQDVNNPDLFGVIRLVDTPTNIELDIDDIIGAKNYTSPNGVVFTTGLKVQFEGRTTPEIYAGNKYYVEGVGDAIKLLPVTDFYTPEKYTQSETIPFDSLGFDDGGFEASLNAPTATDYLTINRASKDGNPWTRSNRWFHIDVIYATASYNNTVAVLNQDNRAKRPILEFNTGLRLFNFGTESIAPVDVIDTIELDALSNVNGSIGYSSDGYTLQQGSRIIFAADLDSKVRNKVYLVNFVTIDDSSEPIIDLQPADITSAGALLDQTVTVLSGIENQGKCYSYNGTAWVEGQQKIAVNQAPLFDIFDNNDYSLSNTTIYPGTSFAGTKLFSYATGTGTNDTVLGFPLKYLSIDNIGDIVFANNLYSDTFVYVSNNTSTTSNISVGHSKCYTSRTTNTNKIGWQTAHTQTTSRQIFTFEYNNLPLVLDVLADDNADTVPLKVFQDDTFILPSQYTTTTNNQGFTEITFVTPPAVGTKIEVSVVSKTSSKIAYYSVATNLENNAINTNSGTFTLGTGRGHYNTICQNLTNFSGQITGANNLRDLGNVVPYGENVIQNSSPLTFASTFLYKKEFDFFDSIDWAGYQYEQYKNLLLNAVANSDWSGYITANILDEVVESLSLGKTENSPFYWSDILPSNKTFDETVYTYNILSSNIFDTLYSYNFTSANYQGLVVYLNDNILVGDGHEYSVGTDGPRITINTDAVTLTVGDKIKIREYTTTYGSFVPATPSSMGLSKVYKPQKYLDNTYTTPTNVIQGHDGSITVAFDDIRDDVLLEFETRIYSNIKVANRYSAPIDPEEVVPGFFRTTDYTLTEVNQILADNFLQWVGSNKIDYKSQTYDNENAFTYNYSRSLNKLDNSLLTGGWRAIYSSLYDTDRPHTHPWEMLGQPEKPSWWEDTYGPGPYTSGNLVLWRDLRDGKLANPAGATILPEFKRPQLLEIIPADSEGNLLPPLDVIVGSYDQNGFAKSWVFGDQGPAETAWRRSSQYRFALQRLFALTKTAKYFALNADIDRYTYDTSYNQYLYDKRYRIQPATLQVYGNGIAKNSYINFIVDYNQLRGLDSTTELSATLENLNIQLIYRLAGFSDKKYLKIFSEKGSPNSLNSSLLLPDESYQLLLYKNPSFETIAWSSVIVQRTSTGYSVDGYSRAKPYFRILASKPNGNFDTINVNGKQARIPKDFSDTVVKVPYGYTFTTINGVVDFLVSYGKLLEQQGLIFDNVENNVTLNWVQIAREFVYWTTQGWAPGSIINLNPGANVLKIEREYSVVDSLVNNQLLDQNNKVLTPDNYVIYRTDNLMEITSQQNKALCYLDASLVSYEHMIIFDNTSIFNDLLYDPATGLRQYRLLVDGYKTYDWNGTLDAEGFILNQDNIKEWVPNQSYSKGEIVLYKDAYWSAGKLLSPTSTFNFNDWIKSDYNLISKGLLPNAATKAALINNYYDTKTANLEQDADQLSFGLIGFRPRQYMQNLNLDDISQVNLYQQFIGTKGTTQAAEIFTQANLNKEVADYQIFENWALQRAIYGANANRSYYELQLDESKLLSNPATIGVVEPENTSKADQKVLVDQIYKASYNIESPNILPLLTENQPDIELPSAGYVNYDEVDIKIFDFDNLLPVLDNISNLLVGTSIWVAKDNSYDWNVYTNSLVVHELIEVRDNLNGTCTFTFNGQHGLLQDQYIVVRFFSDLVDGAFQVVSVPTLNKVTVAFGLPDSTVSLTGIGIVFVLESVKVRQSSDIVNLGFVNSLLPGRQVWSDDDGTGNWAAYQKIEPFTFATDIEASTPVFNNLFGSSISQGLSNQGMVIGATGFNSGIGALYTYNLNDTGFFTEKTIFSPATTDTLNFGKSTDTGGTKWIASGANLSDSSRGYAFALNRNVDTGNFFLTQCFVENDLSSGSQFGYDVAVSNDERWMYISALGDDKVYCYNKTTVQLQQVTFFGDGAQNNFDITGHIVVDDDSADGGIGSQQILINVNGVPQVLGTDFSFVNNIVAFTTPPNTSDEIVIRRKSSISYYPTVSTPTFSVEDIYPITDIYSFSVTVNEVVQRPFLDYTYNANTKIVTLTSGITGSIIFNSRDSWTLVDTINIGSGDSASLTTFGYSIDTTTDGRQLIVGSPFTSAGDEIVGAGKVFLYDRSVERFQVTDTTNKVFTTLRTPVGSPTVKLNNEFLQPTPFNNNGQYTVSGKTITLDTAVTLTVGDIVEIETNVLNLMQTLESNHIDQDINFGTKVIQCPTNCSLYVGQPNVSTKGPQDGAVERWINQNRLYGLITSTGDQPILHPGDTIRINNYDIAVVNPETWTSGRTWTAGDFARDGDTIWLALQNVPIGTATSDTEYWQRSNWVQSYANDINDADIPNVVASYANGKLTLSLVNTQAGDEFIKLIVLPGIGGAWTSLAFKPMTYAQTLYAPVAYDYAHFGQEIDVSDDSLTLAVGSPDGAAYLPTVYDQATTTFDAGALNFIDAVDSSGVVYTFDFLASANANAQNPGKFVLGQQIFDTTIQPQDQFGFAVSYNNGRLVVGAPNEDLDDSVGQYGKSLQYNNINQQSSWQVKYAQQPIVDVQLINGVFTYNRNTAALTSNLDYIDPIKGKILGSVQQNIDFLTPTDPAQYNTGSVNNNGSYWDNEHLGQIWWNLSTVRFIDYHQDDTTYKSKRWGQLFPGSAVDIYQWVSSSVPPGEYTGPGTVFSNTSYNITSTLDANNIFVTQYYFWVKNLTTVATDIGKTLSAQAMAQYIENPSSSGIPYIAPLSPSTIGLYNVRDLVSATDTILHIEFDKIRNNDNVHVEYDLIAANNPESFVNANTFRKFLDSFCGTDTLGNLVPDVGLGVADRYGVSFRPRQSVFIDRYLSLKNYLQKANRIMAQYPIVEMKSLNLLKSQDPEPTSASGQWNKRVLTYDELTYQNLDIVPSGYKYLVANDSTQGGLWTIYQVQSDKTLLLAKLQNYDTNQYWTYTDWIKSGYNLSTRPVNEVPLYSDLLTFDSTLRDGDVVKVTANSFGKSELYQYTNGTWDRVFAEDATIAISNSIWDYSQENYGFDLEVFDRQRLDEYPNIETRQILKALNEEIFVGDLLIHRNELLLLIFDYIMSEQNAPDWLFKTSLVDVQHKIRDLKTYPTYLQDNQDFVLSYINEVKPYHVKIKEFSLKYDGNDVYQGSLSDFDCPAYYNTDLKKFISPILNGEAVLSNGLNNDSAVPSSDAIWTTWPWSQWYDNYTLNLASVSVVNGGSGYTVPPQVTVTGQATTLAVLQARINTAGEVIEIEVISKGSGYTTTPVITISGGNGSGATAVPVMQNTMVRSFDTTLKFDRYEYTSSVQDWAPNTDYVEGSLVRYDDNVYQVNEVADSTELNSGTQFDPDFYTLVDESTLSGVDRIIGLYKPDLSDPGRELALLLSGIDYPGVQVQGPGFNQNTGFDVGNFDINSFDNLDFGPEGLPTYSEAILNAIYSSSFTDTYLGTRVTDINVDGSEFIDTYSSHAPEELVPGSNFDTLDLTVNTRPGADWSGDGHGFNVQSVDYVSTGTSLTVDWSDQMQHPVGVSVENLSTGINLNALQHFTVNWPAKTLSVTDGISADDVVRVRTFGVGGGNQLLRQTLNGSLVSNSLTVDVDYDEIYEILVIVNGIQTTAFTYAAGSNSWQTVISFTSTYTNTDLVTVVVLGTETVQRSWSTPRGEYFQYDGSTLAFTLSESLQGTNPIDMVVFQDGKRLRPPETAQYIGDGSSAGPYYLPTRGQINQGLVSDNDVKVYVDNVEQFLAVDWTLTPWDGSSDRYVAFNVPPDSGANIKIAVTTDASYDVDGSTLTLKTSPAGDAIINVVTFNDTSQQQLLTQVFQGPTEEGTVVTVDFDAVAFDSGDFDETTGIILESNDLATGVAITNDSRIEVTKNGFRLTPGEGYTATSAGVVTIGGGILGPGDVVVITSYTMVVTPEEMSFRIFQDMLENQKIFRINQNNTTTLARALGANDDTIYLTDATKVSPTDIPENILGVVMVGEERITYRTRNLSDNTISGLRRGVAGTAIQSHTAGESVTDSGFGEQLPLRFQQQTTESKFTGDGTTKVFLTSNISLDTSLDSTEIEEVVRVNVGGADLAQSSYTVTQLNPVEVSLIDAPDDGVEIIVSIVKANVMYAQGSGTASNGIALQEQTTSAARFIRGEI